MKKLFLLCCFLLAVCLAAANAAPVLNFAVQKGEEYILTNSAPRKAYVMQKFELNQTSARSFTFGADALANYTGKNKYESFLRVDVTFTDGTVQEWINIGIPVTTSRIRFTRSFKPAKPVKTARLYAMFNGVGTVQFSNLFVENDKQLPPGFAVGSEPEKLGKLTEFRRDLCLFTDLKKSAIIVPDTPAGKKYAAMINNALPRPVPVVPAAKYDRAMKLDRNLILVGNRDNNTAIDHYYLLHKVLLDCYYPGKGGYTVRTLHNPFGDKHNVVFAGGSDEAGTAAAVKQLVKRIRESGGKLPWTQDIKLSPELQVPHSANAVPLWEESRGYGSQGYFGWQSFSRNMMTYYMTGEKRYLDEFIRLAFHAKPDELFKLDDESHHHLPDPMLEPYHYRWVMTPVLWDLVEESPHLSEADRIRVTAKIYEMLKTRISKHYWFSLANSGRKRWTFLPNRHDSWESICVWATANYIARHYDCYEGRHGLFLSKNALYPVDQYSSLKTGSNFWFNTFIQPFFVYAAMDRGRNAIGMPVLKHLAGGLTAFADLRAGDWSQHFSSVAFLRLAAHLVQDQGMYQLADLQNTPEVPFRAGFSFLTTKPYPRNFFEETSGKFFTYAADVRGADWWHDAPFPKKEIIEWLTWREKPAGSGDFLVLCPYPGNASREPFHNYALRTARIGNDLVLNGYCTQLDLFADGTTPGKEARYGRVTGQDVLKDTVVIRGEVRNYNGYDWKRTILLRKNRFLLFWDEVTPLADYKDMEIVNRFQVHGARKKVGGEFSITPPTPLLLKTKGLYTKTGAAEILQANPNAPKPYFQEYAGFEGVRKGTVLQVPFTMKEAAEAWVYLQIGSHVERRADLRIKLDGKTVVEKFHPIASGRVINRLSLGKHRLAAGKHRVTVEILNPDPSFPENSIAAIGTLEVTSEAPQKPSNAWCLASSSAGLRENAGATINFHIYGKGRKPVRFASLIRMGNPDAAKPSVQEMANGMIKLQLPETAWIRPVENGFELLEKDRKTWIPYSGKITLAEKEALPEENTAPAVQTAEAENQTAPFANPVWEQNFTPDHICLAQAVGDGFAFVQKNKLILLKKNGTVERTYTVKAPIGDFCYDATRDVFFIGSRDELLSAVDRKTGKVLWTFTSEMNQILKDSSAFYGMKGAVPGISGVRIFSLKGKPVLFAGSTGTVELLDLDGKLLSRNHHGSGGYLSRFVELPGKGVLGIRHASTPDTHLTTPDLRTKSYGMSQDANGVHMGTYGFGCVSHHLTTVAKLRPDEPERIISTFHGTMTRLGIWNTNGKILRDVCFGSGLGKGGGYGAIPLGQSSMRDLAVADLDGDGVMEIILAYNRRIITVFDPDLKLQKLIRLQANPCTIAVMGDNIIAGCFNGDILWFNKDGELLQKAALPGAVSLLKVCGDTLYAGSSKGTLAAFRQK